MTERREAKETKLRDAKKRLIERKKLGLPDEPEKTQKSQHAQQSSKGGKRKKRKASKQGPFDSRTDLIDHDKRY